MRISILILTLLSLSLCDYDGIDVSAWQGNIDWAKVKSTGKYFAILRAGTGQGNKDKYFDQNYNGAKSVGINVGAYWYSYAKSGSDGESEARHMLNVISGKQFEYPIYVDIEEASIFQAGIASAVAKSFCNFMEGKRYFCGIYSSLSFLNSYFDSECKTKYSIWVAQWSSKCTYKGQYGAWQYSSEGSVSGISGRVDMDKAYVDFPSIMKTKHLNGF